MANQTLSIDNCLIQVRATLQAEGIKLWLVPYYLDGPIDSEIETLALRYSQSLNIRLDYCRATINELQANAIEKLKARDLFRESGVATLKVRVPGKSNGGRLLTLESKLNLLAEELCRQVGSIMEVDPRKLKLIASGRMIDRLKTLQEQGVQNNQQIMAIILEMDEEEASKNGTVFDKLQAVKNDAMTLLRKNDSYMDMEDQDGNIIHLPLEEKRAIMMALAIHEKGRVTLKRKDFNEALIFLLEADSEFRSCNSDLLQTEFRIWTLYGVISCSNLSYLPDADNRLRICERHFKKSYGDNLNRVITLKGNACNERALIMRLHLLQAILNFHQNQRVQAFNLLSTAEYEWQQLQIDESLLKTLIEMGYSDIEARIGLRSCANNVDQALNFIQERRNDLKKARRKGWAERNVKKSLQKTTNSTWVNPRTLHTVTEMGFNSDICALALQKSYNDINQAILLLQERQSEFEAEFSKSVKLDKDLCDQIACMGFDPELVKGMLKQHLNDMQKTIEELLKMQNIVSLNTRYRFGLYDEISISNGFRVRHCNWIRFFLRVSETYGSQVNVVCTKVTGEPIYEIIRPIAAHQELVVYYLPERPEELFFGHMRSSIYRRTMDSILEESPLDLSMSLLSRVMLPISPPSSVEDEHKSVSGESLTSSSSAASSAGDLMDTSITMPRTSPKARPQRSERALLPCEVCSKAFDRPSLLKRHMRTHTGEKPHVCLVCSKGFSTSSSLNTHRRIHSGEKPHQCQVCGKRFTASSNLYYHRMTHIKEKPHKCSLCSKSFPTPGDLKSHMYVHSGSWPFKCHICSRGFSKHTNLKNHLFLHTGDKPHFCELCNKKFALACNLRAHMKTHEGEPQEECIRCGKMYILSSDLNKGACGKCLGIVPSRDQLKSTPFRSSGESDTEEDQEESSNDIP